MKAGGVLEVYSVSITEIAVYKYVVFVLLLIVFALLDIIILNFSKGKFGLNEGILFIICLAAIIPFIADFSYYGHDTAFQLNRIVCLSDEIKQGNYFPAVFSTALNGYGYANPLFYGQFFLYIPAILYTCGFSLTAAYNIYIMIFSIATCLIMYYSSLQIFKKSRQALFAAALYTLSAVRLTNIFTRGAVGEFTAQTFLPLVVLGFYNIYSAEKNEKIPLKKYLSLIIGLTGIFLSHIITILMCAFIIVVFCIVKIRKTFEPKRFAALCKAAALTLLICLSALVPFVDSYSMEMVVNSRINYIQKYGAYLIQIFNVIVDNFQKSTVANTASDEMSLAIGFSIVLGLVLYIYYLINKKKDKENQLFKFSKVCFTITCITIFLSTKYMPYDALDFLPEGLYSLLTVYQFPWRWLTFTTLFGVYLTVYAVGSIGEVAKSKHTPMVAFYAILAILALNTGQIYADQMETSNLSKFSNNSYEYNMENGYGEYLVYDENTSSSDRTIFYYAALIYDEELITAEDYEHNCTTASFYVQNDTKETQKVTLPILKYDNYYAYDEDGNKLKISKGKNGRITVNVPAEYAGEIKVEYHFRYRWYAAICISVMTIVCMAVYGIYMTKKKKVGSR